MRRIKLVLAVAAAMVALMVAAMPAMADGFRLGNGGHNFRSGDNDISFSAPRNATFFFISSTNGLDTDADDLVDFDLNNLDFDGPDIRVG